MDFKRFHWNDIYKAALDNQVDVVATMVNRPDRDFQFAFTRPYIFKSSLPIKLIN